MDPYLKAVGFSKSALNPKKINELIGIMRSEITENPDKRKIYNLGEDYAQLEYEKMFDDNLGVILRGKMDHEEKITIEEIEAIATADFPSTSNHFLVEYSDGEPVIVFEDEGTGNELVFSLRNRIDFYKDEQYLINYGRSVEYSRKEGIIKRKVNFAALSIYGTVVLPVAKDSESVEAAREEDLYYKGLVFKFREGDLEAGEELMDYAEETANTVRNRLFEEDFLSVIEGYFLPLEETEVEYSILGDILSVEEIQNSFNKGKIYKLTINVTGTNVQLFINKRDIIGLPMVGMRFMGNCRLTGKIDI